MAFATSGAQDVRKWAAEQNIDAPETGRLPDDLIAKFNKAHPGKRYSASHVERYSWTAKPSKGKSRTRKINDREVRLAAREAGVKVGERGALRPEVKDAYVLDNLAALAQSSD